MLGYAPTAPWTGSQDLDYLLRQVAESLQLSPTQFEAAEASYKAVSAWLGAVESPLANLSPFIFPHGSVALGTTVKPRRGQKEDEYDVDCVCRLAPSSLGAMQVYALVQERLAAHGTYMGMLERKNRCLRLNFAGQFHLDILPAVPDLEGGETKLLVPDREIKQWTSSDPQGFARWFTARSQPLREIRAHAQPLPEPTPTEDKAALAIAVQLIKRRRDMVFDGSEDAPRSILLTTMAGRVYRGADGIGAALMEVVVGIAADVRRSGERLVVLNPVNENEDFGESLDAGRMASLRDFVFGLERDVASLAALHSDKLRDGLKEMFGMEPTNAAFEKWGQLLNKRRDERTLTVTGKGKGALGVVSAVSARTVPQNQYFGE